MGCPFSNRTGSIERYFRRDVITMALAAGGFGALAACVEVEGSPDVPMGTSDLDEIPERQFAWNEYLSRDQHHNTVFPHHQVILFLDFVSDGLPTESERNTVAAMFDTIDRAYQRGNGGRDPHHPGGTNTPGLLYTMGYSGSYFERFDEPLPASAGLGDLRTMIEAIDEDPDIADPYDAALVLTSDHAEVLLAIELALYGDIGTLNGVTVEGTFDGILEVAERRTGFVGAGVPRRELDRDDIPSRSPLAMGFVSGFADNQATEDRVAIDEGPFRDGSVQQISRLQLDLDKWYQFSLDERIDRMFSPEHDEADVGEVGQLLASDSGLTVEMDEMLEEHATELGIVGHTQKLAASRDENFEPKILRRSEAVSTDDPHPGMNFTSLQRDIEDFVAVRKAMNGDHLDIDLDKQNDGILAFIEVSNRATFLVPPRSRIALPSSRPEAT